MRKIWERALAAAKDFFSGYKVGGPVEMTVRTAGILDDPDPSDTSYDDLVKQRLAPHFSLLDLPGFRMAEGLYPNTDTVRSDTAWVVQPDLWLVWRDKQIKLVDSLRRERHSMGAGPIMGIVDYAAAAQAITLAMQAMDEGIPNGQRKRVEESLVLLWEGTLHLRTWLEAKGYYTTTRRS